MNRTYGAFELKATYQRNLLIGAGLSAFVMLGPVLALLIVERATITVRGGGPDYGATDIERPPDSPPARSRGEPSRGRFRLYSGFLGRKVKIISEGYSPPTVVSEYIVASAVPSLDADWGEPDNGEIESPEGNYGTVDYGLPHGDDHSLDFALEWSHEFRLTGVKPLEIYLAQVQYPRAAWATRTEGIASVRIIVGGNGQLDSCELVEERPYRWGFGRALIGALKKARFKPAKRDGEPVTSEVIVTYQFVCRPPLNPTLTTSGGVQVFYGDR